MRTDKIGMYNAASYRTSKRGVASWLDRHGRKHGLLAWVVVEAHQHFPCPKGWVKVQFNNAPDAHTTMLLVRKRYGIRVTKSWPRVMSVKWYGFRSRKMRAPRTLPVARLTTFPWRRHRILVGLHYPVGNPKARTEIADTVAEIARNWPKTPVVAGGDWNAPARDMTSGYGPMWLAQRLRFGQGHAGTIDHAMGRARFIDAYKLHGYAGGSDHTPVIVKFRW